VDRSRWLLGALTASLLLLAACGDDDSAFTPRDGSPIDAASGPANCGDGIAEEDELCDGKQLRSQTCNSATLGAMPGGTLACKSDCTFDVSACSGAEDDGGADDAGAEADAGK
jgi:hypothetical protein